MCLIVGTTTTVVLLFSTSFFPLKEWKGLCYIRAYFSYSPLHFLVFFKCVFRTESKYRTQHNIISKPLDFFAGMQNLNI